ncbi:MAG: type II secretion system protein [Nitrospirota bacterium]
MRGRLFFNRLTSVSGFTLLELMVVISIIGILITIAGPSYNLSVRKAKEAVLKNDLFIMRDLIDQYYADNAEYPSSLYDLVEKGYLRQIPVDPITKSSDTWVEVYIEEEDETMGVFDIHSGSDLVGTNDVPYNEW